jgi:hypothetical protein
VDALVALVGEEQATKFDPVAVPIEELARACA